MTLDTLKKIISVKFKIAETEIHENSHIFNDLKFDSLDAVELIIELEEHYNIELLDKEAENIQTIKEIITLINSKL